VWGVSLVMMIMMMMMMALDLGWKITRTSKSSFSRHDLITLLPQASDLAG
jgi:hypothetical protein